MSKVYYDEDANLEVLQGKTIAIIGFGSQGSAQAQNLRDSGLEVIVSDLPGTPGFEKARNAGFSPLSAAEAAQKGDVIQILAPDQYQAGIYKESIAPHLKAGGVLMFSHGFNIHYHQIIPPRDVDVIMVAPKGPGDLVRRMYQEGKGVPSQIGRAHV